MAIIVEDGTEVTGANSYTAHTDLAAYATLRGVTLTSVQADREALLIEAMDAMEGYNWRGERKTTTQPLAWPRTGVYRDGQLLANDEIPRELFYGQLSLAITAISTTLVPSQAANASGPVIEEQVDGAIAVKYANPGKILSVAADARADALLSVLVHRSGLSVVRA